MIIINYIEELRSLELDRVPDHQSVRDGVDTKSMLDQRLLSCDQI